MMTSNPRCEILKKRLTELYEDYAAVVNQLGRTLGAVDETHLERQMAELEARIEEWDEKIRLCELGAIQAAAQQRRKHLESDIPKINFTEVFEVLTQITERTKAEQGGAALLMLQNAHAMGGTLCMGRVKRLLSEGTSDFRHYEIGLTSGDRLDPWTVMRRLGSYLGCAPPEVEASPLQLQDYVQSLRSTLEGSVQCGSIILLEIRTWDHHTLPTVFLPWFVRDFWTPLVQRLPDIARKNPLVTVICVIVAHTPVQMADFDPALQCCGDAFDPAKLLPLSLRCWEQAEIYDWLIRYSGLGAPAIGVEPTQIATMAERIYLAAGNGQPMSVRQTLLDAIEEYYVAH
jgi:hypothetical protein